MDGRVGGPSVAHDKMVSGVLEVDREEGRAKMNRACRG